MPTIKNNLELQQAIMGFLGHHRANPQPFKSILNSLPPALANRTTVRKCLEQMCREGLIRFARKLYAVNAEVSRERVRFQGKTIVGKIGVSKGQQLIFTPLDLSEPVKVFPENLCGAIPGDRVEVAYIQKGANRPPTARVLRIQKRSTRPIIVAVHRGFIKPRIELNLPFRADREVPDGIYHARTSPEISHREIKVEILGPVEHLRDVDWMELAEQMDIPTEFSRAALQDAEKPVHDLYPRTDLTSLLTCTIDGDDAKDFDDAISLKAENGDYRLYVHIADVASFVRPSTALDQEALLRATSVYFPGAVIPMLPEKLSNDLCSLVPGKPRRTLTCEMLISKAGTVKEADVYTSLIHSDRRFTYQEVQSILDEKRKDPWLDTLQLMHKLFQILNRQRQKEGSLDFDLPEHKFILDENLKIQNIKRSERLDSMRLIEEFMLIANQTIARFQSQAKIPTMYRFHDAPKKEKVRELLEVLRNAKVSCSIKDFHNPLEWQALIRSLPPENREFLEPMIIRSMQQAVYSASETVHFGLGKKFYCHFTSPIRRYPDLYVHRQIHRFLASLGRSRCTIHPLDKQARKAAVHSTDDVSHMALKCSRRERRAMEAEREYSQRKKAEFMTQFIGQEWEGKVSGLNQKGIFIELKSWPVEGMIPLENLPGAWRYDRETQTAFCRNRPTIRMGTQLKVKLLRTDVLKARIDFGYAGGL